MPKKIFWLHPQLTDYRICLFDLMSQRYDVTFYFIRPSEYDDRYKCAPHKGRLPEKSLFIPNYLRNLSSVDIKVIKKEIKNCDIVISSFLASPFTNLATLFCKIFNKKLIILEEEACWFIDTIKYRIIDIHRKIVSKYADTFFIFGQPQYDYLLKIGVHKDKIFRGIKYPGVIYNNIQVKPTPFYKSSFNLLYIGRFVRFKGIDYLLKAVEILNSQGIKFSLNIVGYGILEKTLKHTVNRMRLNNVYFLGKITDTKKKAYLFKNSDAVIIPSIIDPREGGEGGPFVVLEAISAGTAVIGSNVLGNTKAFVIDGKTGYTVEQKNEKDLASKIKLLFEDLKEGRISRKSIFQEFQKIPKPESQFNRFVEAIDYVSE